MAFNPEIHRRQSIRMPNYDYSQSGAYFITICCYERQAMFGEIVQGQMIHNDAGFAAQNCWREIPTHFHMVFLDEFIIMPNHMHGIIVIDAVGANNHSPNENIRNIRANNHSPLPDGIIGTSKTIGSIIRGFKIGVTMWHRHQGKTEPNWQRNYWERVIRTEQEMQSVRQYIRCNPAQWQHDDLNDL